MSEDRESERQRVLEQQRILRRMNSAAAGSLRASDAEREQAAHALAEHYADGRLERAEFDERVEAALAARTQRQLEALFTDLPGPSPVAAVARSASGRDARRPVPAAGAREDGRREAGVPLFPLALLAPILLLLAVTAVLHGVVPIPLFVLLFILSRRGRRWNREARPWT